MALDDSTKINLSLKKIQGKAQTSNQKEVYNESIGSNVSIGASTVFGKVIPAYVSSSYYSIISGTAERVRFEVSPIEGTKDGSGYYQGFELKLPTDYEASSSNTKAGTEPFTDGKVLNTTNGKLQIIPPSFGNGYTVTAFHTSSGETQITALDARDWVLDYFNGVFFQQDPPSDITENPVFVDGFLYIEDYADVLLASGSGGGGGADGQGPINSLQFHTGSGGISGSANLTFTNNTLFVTGTLIVSGAIEANTFEIISTTVTEIDQSGSTAFGDTNDDTHHFTGSLAVFSSSADLFAVDVENKSTKIKTGLTLNRTAVTTNYSVLPSDYYIGIDTATPSAQITASLPDASTLNDGQVFVFKDEGGAADTHNIVISASSGQTIDNRNQVVLESPYSSLSLYCNGTDKFFIV
jgi:hypothetical protein